jgi:hypothetical protein
MYHDRDAALTQAKSSVSLLNDELNRTNSRLEEMRHSLMVGVDRRPCTVDR